jgi:SAM-dependent methyltransferase
MRMDAQRWDERYASTDLVWSAGPNVFVEEELSYLPPGRALDLACGEGRNALWLAQRGWDVTAVDFSKVAIEKGRNIERMRRTSGAGVASSFGYIHWKVADATTFTSERDFDVVVMAYVQLAAEPRRAAIRAGFETLRRGGIFLLVAHDSSNLTEGSGGPQDPAVLYTAEDVLRDLEGESFSVSRAKRVQRAIPGDTTTGEPDTVAWDALVRLTRE